MLLLGPYLCMLYILSDYMWLVSSRISYLNTFFSILPQIVITVIWGRGPYFNTVIGLGSTKIYVTYMCIINSIPQVSATRL